MNAATAAASHDSNPYYFSGDDSACNWGTERMLAPLRWQYSPQTWPQEWTIAVWNAHMAWRDMTDVTFGGGSELTWRRSTALDEGTLGAQSPLAWMTGPGGDCYVTKQWILLNRPALNGTGVARIQNVAAHEIGHAIGLKHMGDVPQANSYCSPDSIMLDSGDLIWNLLCQWITPHNYEVWNANSVY